MTAREYQVEFVVKGLFNFVLYFCFRNTVIQMSLSEDKKRVRIDYLNFFGSEARNTVSIEDIDSVTPLKIDSSKKNKYEKVLVALNNKTTFVADISNGQFSDELLSKVTSRVNDGIPIDIEFPDLSPDENAARPMPPPDSF